MRRGWLSSSWKDCMPRGEYSFRGKERVFPDHTERTVVFGRERRGWLCVYKTPPIPFLPRTVFYADRRPDEIFRDDMSWAIDLAIESWLRLWGTTHIGVKVTDGTSMILPVSRFKLALEVYRENKSRAAATPPLDPLPYPEGFDVRDFSDRVGRAPGAVGKRGALQFYVEERAWFITRPPVEVRHGTLSQLMKVR